MKIWNKYLFIFSTLIAFTASGGENTVIIPGAEQPEKYLHLIHDKSVALVVNQTSMVEAQHLADFLLEKEINIIRIFAPEHGFRVDADAGEHVKNSTDKLTGVEIVSIYGKNKRPHKKHLSDIDVIIFDIQDVGCRFYTYISTLHYVMEACAQNGVELIVLDRPNPNGDYIAGPVLDTKFKSFIGVDPIPIVHGCTVGELALMINGEGWLNHAVKADLKIIHVANYTHKMHYTIPIKPSPNLPNNLSVRLYPSLCLFEATSVSIGRGTHHPFQVLGHPNPELGEFSFKPISIEGMSKEPPHKDVVCYGSDLRETDHPPQFTLSYFLEWYNRFENEDEFLTRERWFNLLIGNDTVLKQIRAGKSEEEITNEWKEGLDDFRLKREKYLLYPDFE